MSITNIPEELRALPQWVYADRILKEPLNPRTGYRADVTDPNTWGTFESVKPALSHGFLIGFVLSPNDPYTIIDLDDKPEKGKPASEEDKARFKAIIQTFNTYTERSSNGLGYHVICRGRIPTGVHRGNIEVYSDARYMVCTGDHLEGTPLEIRDGQHLLEGMYSQMKPPEVELVQIDGDLTDAEIVERASNAANGEKFDALCNCTSNSRPGVADGSWLNMGYASQSDADMALLSIIAFYTQDNEQVYRIFRASGLGKRDKAMKNNVYLDYALRKIRANQPPPVDFTELVKNAFSVSHPNPEPEPSPSREALQSNRNERVSEEPPPSHQGGKSELGVLSTDGQQARGQGSLHGSHRQEPAAVPGRSYPAPPGLIGDLASYIYQSSVRPVPEIALAAALTFVAGISGRAYRFNQTGLNLYTILLAETGVGKEGMDRAITRILMEARKSVPMAMDFMGPGKFASGQALARVMSTKPVMMCVMGEFGLTLQQMLDNRAISSMVALKSMLLDLFGKSGYGSILRGTAYSDNEKTLADVDGPALTILGESTPSTFFEGLDASHIAEGLVPRFLLINYDGPRPPLNPHAGFPPPPALMQRVVDLITVALTTSANNTVCDVQRDAEGAAILDAFEVESTGYINASQGEVERQLWNRAHLKALKLAAVVAVGIDPHRPIVTVESARYAVDMVRRDVEFISSKYQQGDVGTGDAKQMADVRRAVETYMTSTKPPATLRSESAYKLFTARIVPLSYLVQKTANLSAFKNDRLGATSALTRTMKSMVDSGVMIEVPKVQLANQFGFSGVAYAVGKEW